MPVPLLYAATVLIWGSSWFAITLQLGHIHPVWSVAYRFALASAMLFGFCLIARRRLRFSARDHAFFALQGLLLFSLNYVLFYFVIEDLTSGIVAVVFSTIVFMNMVNAALIFRIRVKLRVLVGAVLGLTGIALVFWPELAAFQAAGSALASLPLALVATWVASLGNMVAVRNHHRALPVIEGNTFGMAYGTVFTTLAALAIGAEPDFEWSLPYVGSLVFLALFATVIAFGCYLSLLGRIGPDRAAYASVLFPVVALVLSTLLEGYQWSAPALVGVATVLLGNVLVLAREPRTTG